MSRTFLKREEFESFRESLCPPPFTPDGRFHGRAEWPSAAFSEKLLELLKTRWFSDEDFEKAGPVLLGSAARGELCPRSDLDLLFVGSEEAAARFIRRQQEAGFRLRSRVPEDLKDWSVGVETPDLLALLEATALTPEAETALSAQKDLLRARAGKDRKTWLRDLLKERAEREARFDSIANVLEPNLKYGPGGLRDLDQGRQILALFPERFESAVHAREILESYAGFLLLVRQKLHLEGQGDLLSGPAQFDIARWLGMEHRDFMRQIQRGLSRVHFYSTWIAERAKAPERRWRRLESLKLRTRGQALQLLEKDSSVLAQQRIRQDIDRLFPEAWTKKASKERGRLLAKVLRPGAGEDFVAAVFGSRLIDKLCPEIKPLIGLVQHDQYHRYTADVHLQQACREWQRVLKKPGRLGVLAGEVRALKPVDRRILGWAVLYHDLMKGREGDHSELGRELVQKDLAGFGVPAAERAEVEWIVEHHLELSQAAFRRNPMSPSTWLRLQEIGAEGSRLRRLAVFTAVDILATNPEAWTPWKARLINDLLRALRSSAAQGYFRFHREAQKNSVTPYVDAIDAFLMTKLPARTLSADLAAALAARVSLPPQVFRLKGHGVWVRFHEKEDRPGLFAEFVQRLYSLGVGIRHAAVHTLPEIGVYDWFEITSRRKPAQIRAWLETSKPAIKALPSVTFSDVSLVAKDENEWIFSFKGIDQPGFLATAAAALAEEKASLKSARVHTWGRQVDDLFAVIPSGDPGELLTKLRRRLGLK